jgi:hypothetical protein
VCRQLKEKRQKEQLENVRKKKEQLEKHKQKSLDGMKKKGPPQNQGKQSEGAEVSSGKNSLFCLTAKNLAAWK